MLNYIESRNGDRFLHANGILGFVILVIIGVILIFLLIGGVGEAETIFVDDDGDWDYTSIQAAIDNASVEDTVKVYDGTYFENLTVNKSISLIGNGPGSTMIIGDNTTAVINITADNITVSGFTITEGRWGTRVFSNNNSFYDNDFTNNLFGIRLEFCGNNTIKDNIFSFNYTGISGWFYTGISGWFAHQNHIINNTIFGNNYTGIDFQNSDNNTLRDNNLSNNRRGMSLFNGGNYTVINNTFYSNEFWGICISISRNFTLKDNRLEGGGIWMFGSRMNNWNTHDIDTSNMVNGKPIAYYKNVIGIPVLENAGQIILANCTGMEITNQNFSQVTNGLQLGFSSDIKIMKNVFYSNRWYGMSMENSQHIEITHNYFTNNRYGIYLYYCNLALS